MENTKILKEIFNELNSLNYLLHNFIILQLVERGLGREDIKKIVKGLDNRDYTAIYGAYKRSANGKK